jgi:hypothetical protein
VVPAVLGCILAVGGISVAGTATEPQCRAIAPAPIVVSGERHQLVTGFVPKAVGVPVDSCFQEPSLRVLPANHANAPKVRPPVEEFLKRVVVPILVERYIARLNRDRLLAGTGEAS